MKKFVIGDIHGRNGALREVLKKSGFDYENDKLIVLGDVVDGGSGTYDVVEELLKIKNIVFVIGNHDEWFMNHIKTGWAEEVWLSQGGRNTLKSYGGRFNLRIPVTHQAFFNNGVYWHFEGNKVFVHGGFDPKVPIKSQDRFTLLWDRSLIERFRNGLRTAFDRVFVGHTTTQTYGNDPLVKDCLAPIKFGNLVMMDCGAGWSGKLAIMNIDTEEYWVSRKQLPCR